MQVSLDDFGTGYSALSYLNKFDIDYLKIDQSFVRNLAPNTQHHALCEAIIVMSHKLGLKVIAEGIETATQRDLLLAAGCDYGQGYFYAKPMPASEFELLLLNAEMEQTAKGFTAFRAPPQGAITPASSPAHPPASLGVHPPTP